MSKKRKPDNRKRRASALRESQATAGASGPVLVLVAEPDESTPTLLVQPPVPRKVLELCPGPENSLATVEVPAALVVEESSDAEATRELEQTRDTEPTLKRGTMSGDEPTLDSEPTLPRDTIHDTEPVRDTEPTLSASQAFFAEQTIDADLVVEPSASGQTAGSFDRPADDPSSAADKLPWPPPARRATTRWVAGAILTAATILLVSGGVKAAGNYRTRHSLADSPRAVAAKTATEVSRTLPPGLRSTSPRLIPPLTPGIPRDP